MSFGKNLARFRKERELTQEDLVNKSGVAISQIRRYETDKSSPTLEVIKRLAISLGASLDELVFDKATGIADKKILDSELLEQFEQVSTLDEDEKHAVKIMLGGIIVKHQVEQAIAPKTDKTWSRRFREVTNKLAEGAKGYSDEKIDEIVDEAVVSVRSKYAPA